MQKHFKFLLLLLAASSLALVSCKKDKDDDDPILETGEVSFSVDGASHSHDELPGSFTYSSDDTTQFMAAWFDPADDNHYFIAIGISQFTPDGTNFVGEAVWNLFAPGSKAFAREGVQPNGAVVEWRAPDGTYYTSLRGDQTGSSFVITERADYPGDLFLGFEAGGTFSCKVYDGNGNSKTISNGAWKGVVPLN